MPHMSCLDHTPGKQYLGHIFEHCQRVRWALHPILLNLHTLWNRPAHPSHLALKTERNLHPLCGKGVQSYQNHQHFSDGHWTNTYYFKGGFAVMVLC